MKHSPISVVFVLFSLFAAACTSENEKEVLLSQDVAIERYITQQLNIEDSTRALAVVSNDGAYRLIYEEGSGSVVAPGDLIEFSYIASIFNNGPAGWYDTNVKALDTARTNAGSDFPAYDLGKGVAGVGYYISGLDKGLLGMKEGEHAQIVFSAAHGYGNKSMGVVPSLSSLIFEVFMEKVEK